MHSCIVADIGGTNARFAIADESGMSFAQVFSCKNYPSFESIFEAYLETLGGKKVDSAALAIATHVTSDWVQFTNLPWEFSVSEVAKRYGFLKFKVLNDFAAMAIAIPLLSKNQLVKVCGGVENEKSAKALIGAGTGLGMSGLLPNGDAWIPVEGEGGHIRLSSTNAFEKEIFSCIQKKQQFVSAETILSGPGLVSLYKAIAMVEGNTDCVEIAPSTIVAQGMSGNSELSEKVLSVFCGLLGSVAGDLALILGAQGGVYIGGGVINHIRDFFVKDTNFKEHFEQKGPKADYMKKIPVNIISDTKSGLLGAWGAMSSSYSDIGITWEYEPENNNNNLLTI